MSNPVERFELDGITWERYNYGPGDDMFQRACLYCDRGLLYAPVRDCSLCRGSGYFVQTTDPRSLPAFHPSEAPKP